MADFRRDGRWQMIRPGLYIDPEGHGHVFPDEVLATLGWPYTKENYDLIVETIRELCGRVEVIAHEREAS